jgi:violaxanthin de-epoxidase
MTRTILISFSLSLFLLDTHSLKRRKEVVEREVPDLKPNMSLLSRTLLSLFAAVLLVASNAFVPTIQKRLTVTQRSMWFHRGNDDDEQPRMVKDTKLAVQSSLFALGLTLASWTMPLSSPLAPLPAMATDSGAIVSCLFQKCQAQLAKCIVNPKCLANVICINTCNGREDETECQIKCGNLFENDVVGDFNKCAITAATCVPQKQDTGEYPVPPVENLVPKFDTKLFNGRWYITAGQNALFDIFPCQVHFFEETKPGTIYGKINWRIEEPDGEFFTRDALQRFIQDPKQPSLLANHDNEYLHYQDDWYIVDFENDNNPDGVPPFVFIYYRGSNDAWIGYGGAVVYTREASLPKELIPRLKLAAEKVNMNFDKQFTLTDNTCPSEPSDEEIVLLRERFAGNAVLSTERQLQAQATLLRGNVQEETKQFSSVALKLEKRVADFEKEVIREAEELEKELEKDFQKFGFLKK